MGWLFSASLGTYWAKALALIPELHFELVTTLLGADGIALYYKGARGTARRRVFL